MGMVTPLPHFAFHCLCNAYAAHPACFCPFFLPYLAIAGHDPANATALMFPPLFTPLSFFSVPFFLLGFVTPFFPPFFFLLFLQA